jgi:hypothetical protein
MCWVLPTPTVAMLSSPGCCFAAVRKPSSERHGAPGATSSTSAMLATTVAGSTILGASSFTKFDLWNSPSGDQSGNLAAADVLRLFGDFTINNGATLQLSNPNARTFISGDIFRLFDWAGLGTLTGTFGSNIDSTALGLGVLGLGLDTTNLFVTSGALAGTISIVPEPGRALLMLLGLMALFFRRRRED